MNTISSMEYAYNFRNGSQYISLFDANNTASFNYEAQRRAQEYLDSLTEQIYESFGLEYEELGAFGKGVYNSISGIENVTETVLLPGLNGLAGSFKGIGKALENVFEDGINLAAEKIFHLDDFGFEINALGVPSMNDAMWNYIYAGGDSGQLNQGQIYVMQAANSLGNMAIPMILNFVPGAIPYSIAPSSSS